MEPGVSLTLWPPKLYGVSCNQPKSHRTSLSDEHQASPPRRVSVWCFGSVPERNSGTTQWTRNIFEGQALGLLVPVGWALLLYTSGLSTQSSTGGLTRLTRWETSS